MIETLGRYKLSVGPLKAILIAGALHFHLFLKGWGVDDRHGPDPLSTGHALLAVGPVFSLFSNVLKLGESQGGYGILPGSAPSVYASALLLFVRGANMEAEAWLKEQRLADGSYQGNVLATAAVLTWGDIESSARAETR